MSNTELLTKEKELEIEIAYKKFISSFHALPKEIKEGILSDIPTFCLS